MLSKYEVKALLEGKVDREETSFRYEPAVNSGVNTVCLYVNGKLAGEAVDDEKVYFNLWRHLLDLSDSEIESLGLGTKSTPPQQPGATAPQSSQVPVYQAQQPQQYGNCKICGTPLKLIRKKDGTTFPGCPNFRNHAPF